MTQLTEISSSSSGDGESTSAASASVSSQQPPKKHCWECLRRRLVCDSARPACERCQGAGIVCPGYEDKQPLRWVNPGQITVRRPRRRREGTDNVTKDKGRGKAKKKSPGKSESEGDLFEKRTIDARARDGERGFQFGTMAVFGAMQARALDQLMRFDVTRENFAAMQAAYHYNVEIYERCSPTKLLFTGPKAELPTPAPYAILPAPLKCLMILIAVTYQAQRLPRDTDTEIVRRSRFAVANWKYQVVQALNADISSDAKRLTDGTLVSVYMLLCVDQHLEPSLRWRLHYEALMNIIRQRGGVRTLCETSPHLVPGLNSLLVMEAFANTTSPATDQLRNLTTGECIEIYKSVCGDGSEPCGTVCPLPLFFDLVRVNHLRAGAVAEPIAVEVMEEVGNMGNEAEEIVERLVAFSPEEYAERVSTPRTRDHWVLVGRVYHSAVLLYAIISMQSVGLLSTTSNPTTTSSIMTATTLSTTSSGISPQRLETLLKAHYDRLLIDLQHGLRHPNLQASLAWPTIVAGVRAKTPSGSAFERAYIADQLGLASKDLGCASPLLARSILMAFWEKEGQGGWDECFVDPCWFSAV
ncbi:hypothetical protein F5Y16DRAFT_411376 [Xylariaceae sp. FL0255]|nr:hypothetical protein F5Y16DRAFT_411376 [Xylariaceae sp. FL0255]